MKTTTAFTTKAATYHTRKGDPEEVAIIRIKTGRRFTGCYSIAVDIDGNEFGRERRVYRRHDGSLYTEPRNPLYGQPGEPKYLEEDYFGPMPEMETGKHPAIMAQEARFDDKILEQILEIMNRGNDVREWPNDERQLYRSLRAVESLTAAHDAVDRVRAQKILRIARYTGTTSER
jgi:hypothetical protein